MIILVANIISITVLVIVITVIIIIVIFLTIVNVILLVIIILPLLPLLPSSFRPWRLQTRIPKLLSGASPPGRLALGDAASAVARLERKDGCDTFIGYRLRLEDIGNIYFRLFSFSGVMCMRVSVNLRFTQQ